MHELFDALERSDDDRPFLLVNSFVNPHDIVFYGLVWSRRFDLPYPDLQQVPPIPPPPTEDENLLTKPKAQKSYVERYRQMFLPQPVSDLYRRFYYFLQARVDRYILDVMHRLERSPYRENTIIVFTSDHGDVLGAHGKMHQKWFNAYEEAIHVPLIFSGPLIADTPRDEHALTSHADLIPTLLGLCDIDIDRAAKQLAQSHSETRPFVGRDLSPLVRGNGRVAPEPVFFMTFDNVSQGLSQVTGGRQWEAVVSPNQLETVIVELDGALWKYTMYAQNLPTPYEGQITNPEILEKIEAYRCVDSEFEMYNLTEDPYECTNLAFPTHATAHTKVMQERLQRILDEQRLRKCLTPKVQQGEPRAGGEGLIDFDLPPYRDLPREPPSVNA